MGGSTRELNYDTSRNSRTLLPAGRCYSGWTKQAKGKSNLGSEAFWGRAHQIRPTAEAYQRAGITSTGGVS